VRATLLVLAAALAEVGPALVVALDFNVVAAARVVHDLAAVLPIAISVKSSPAFEALARLAIAAFAIALHLKRDNVVSLVEFLSKAISHDFRNIAAS
jgi:hypothetical protein